MTNPYDSQNLPFDRELHLHNSMIGAIGDNNTVNFLPRDRIKALLSLPPDITDFVGREAQQAMLIKWLEQVEDPERTAPVIVGISGMAGVGKSRLAVRVLHKLEALFPDGQVYLNLRGADQEPMSATQVLLEVLRDGFGLEEQEIALEQRGREAQYRSLMAQKRIAVLLDNAFDEAQVYPLRPSGRSSAVVVTSRERLELDGELLDLKPMMVGTGPELGESEALLHEILRRVSPRRVLDDLGTARRIVELCGRLPIAIRIAAATLKMPLWEREALGAYHDELAKEETRLAKLENERVEKAHPGQGRVRASFNLSYRALANEDAQLFRFLGILVGKFEKEVIGPFLILSAVDQKVAKARLTRLVNAQLLEVQSVQSVRRVVFEGASELYQFHDLIRLFAKEKLEQDEDSETRQNFQKVLVWFFYGATRHWAARLNCERQVQDEFLPEKTSYEQNVVTETQSDVATDVWRTWAVDWFRTYLLNTFVVVELAYTLGMFPETVGIATHLTAFLLHESDWENLERTCKFAIASAQKVDDPLVKDHIYSVYVDLGNAYSGQERYKEAILITQESQEFFQKSGDKYEQARALCSLGNIYKEQGQKDQEQAISCYQECMKILQMLDTSQAKIIELKGVALANLGHISSNKGDLEIAISFYENSLELLPNPEARSTRPSILIPLGNLYADKGCWEEAHRCFEESYLTGRSSLTDLYTYARASEGLGRVWVHKEEWHTAITCYESSLSLLQELNNLSSQDSVLNIKASVLMGMGDAYKNMENWDNAINYYEQSISDFQLLDEEYNEALVTYKLAMTYLRQCYIHQQKGDIEIGQLKLNQSFDLLQRALEKLPLDSELGKTISTMFEGSIKRRVEEANRQRNKQGFSTPTSTRESGIQPLTSTSHTFSKNYSATQKPPPSQSQLVSQSKLELSTWLLRIGVVVFLIACLLEGQWLIALIGLAIAAAILWSKQSKRGKIKKS